MIIVVDSDGLIGSVDPSDAHYSNCQKILLKMGGEKATLIYPATVIAEVVTFLQGRLNKPDLADAVLQKVSSEQFVVEAVDIAILKEASTLMDFKRSKHHTLFDAIVATIAQKHKADAIFSFDKFYKSQGFKLASDLK